MSKEIKDEYIGEYKVVDESTGKGYEYYITQYGDKYWYLEGKLHRLDGPSFEHANGGKSWYVEGKLHRLDGPAIEYADGGKEWYVEGNLHRLDGPAIKCADGYIEYWYNGERLDEEYKSPLELSGKEAVDYLLKLQLLK